MNLKRHSWGAVACALITAVVITACKPKTQSAESKGEKISKDLAAKEQQLLSDPNQAIAEIERRLHQGITAADGLVTVSNEYPAFAPIEMPVPQYVLPARTPWVLSCGLMGMDLVFGSSMSGGSQDDEVSNDVTIRLFLSPIQAATCKTLGPAIGKEVEATINGKRNL